MNIDQTEISNLPEGWKKTTLGEVVTLVTKGTTPITMGFSFEKKGVNFIKSESLDYEGNIDESKFVKISEETHERLKRSQIQKDDILFSMAGAYLGKSALVNEKILPANTNQAVAIIRPNKNIVFPMFISMFLRTNKVLNYINSIPGQSAQPNINFQEIRSIPLILPNMNEQHSIAKILSDLDEKIELNQQMNKTFESIAQALFKRWFVDFEFPDSQGHPYKSSGRKMVDSKTELGEIPDSWEIKKLKEIVLRLGPGTNYQPERVKQGIPFLNVKNVKEGFLDLNDIKFISEEEYIRVHKSWKPEEHDILITRIGTLGNVAIIRREDLPLAVHYNMIDIKSKDTSYAFIYFLLKSEHFQYQYHLKKQQTVQEYITIEDVENIILVMPPYKILERLDAILLDLANSLENNYVQIETLAKVRNSLLPRLMSGRIRVI